MWRIQSTRVYLRQKIREANGSSPGSHETVNALTYRRSLVGLLFVLTFCSLPALHVYIQEHILHLEHKQIFDRAKLVRACEVSLAHGYPEMVG